MLQKYFHKISDNKDTQATLALFGILFLLVFSLILTFSSAVRFRSWDVDYLWSHWIGFLIWLLGFIWFINLSNARLDSKDNLLVPILGILIGWGILSIWRISLIFGLRQAAWFLFCVWVSSRIFKHPSILSSLKKYKYILLILGLLLAALTFIFGSYPGGEGPRLWLGLRGIYFQPSELLKLLLILYLSAYFSEIRVRHLHFLNSILPALVLFFSALFLLIAQRDLGTSLIFIVIFILMLFIKYGKKRILLFGFFFILLATIVGYLTIDLVRIRFHSWILPWLDPQAGSYQIIQSIIAIAAGGLSGTGIGLGSPRVIPIAHSDFIYSAIVEETGLFGGLAILLLYALLFSRGIKIAIESRNQYYQFLATGIVIYLTAQAILIIGGNVRLLPITGVTLPFISYGGSSLLISFISVCFLLLMDSNANTLPRRDHMEIKTTSILYISFFSGLLLLALVTGWWSFVRSSDLQFRSDNPRHFIAARFVERGAILDRNDQLLAYSVGEIGNYQRTITYPPLSNTIGFSNSNFGNAGLEAALDDYLSGERGYPAFDLWFNYLLYDEPLPGRDIRLTLDLNIQKHADNLIGDFKGSAVVINADSGEILAIASHPYFNANLIESNWNIWRNDEASPLINRATQGAYPIGNLITPFLLTKLEQITGSSETDFDILSVFQLDSCAIDENEVSNHRIAVKNGCDSALIRTANLIGEENIKGVISQYSLDGSQNIGLPTNKKTELPNNSSWYDLIYGETPLRVNPLQLAVSASAISTGGKAPVARIISAVNLEEEGWVIISQKQDKEITPLETSILVNEFLKSEAISGWEVTVNSKDQNGSYSWYIAGTQSSWPGTPIVVVLILERDNPEFAQIIGREIYEYSTQKTTLR